MSTAIEHRVVETRRRGWDVIRLSGAHMEIDVVPGKGTDIVAARAQPSGVDVLWSTPWGLRPRGSVPLAQRSEERFLENYPGGWQMVFPNAGDPSDEGGAEQGFHGEASLAPWGVVDVAEHGDSVTVGFETRLVRSPFRLRRRMTLDAGGLLVEESAVNEGSTPREVMWTHHPAFGAPFLDPCCTVRTGARRILVDADREHAADELQRGAHGTWPHVAGRAGTPVDLSRIPARDARAIRFGYLTDFEAPWYAIDNPALGIEARVSWDAEAFPHAWYWMEAGGTTDYPWYGGAHVLAIEPASSFPGQGLARVRATTRNQVTFAAGERREAWVRLQLSSR
jgi:galactose mutarotase-like enzyme